MKKTIFVLMSILVVFSSASVARAQSLTLQKEMLVGTWRLIAASNVTGKGVIKDEAYGRDPTGLLTYTADGRMMALITDGGRKRLSKYFRVAPAGEQARAYSTSLSYAGTFTLNGNRVIHHVEVSSDPNRVNADLVRIVTKMEGDRITLRTTATFTWDDGVQYAYQELVWERVK
jgi:hypothetical protein